MKKFDIPTYYRSDLIGAIKASRKLQDPRKRDFAPLSLVVGDITFVLPRHFGFCYGVENAIEVSYKAIAENPDKPLYLLSEMIHNPAVNEDLQRQGIQFIMNTEGQQIIPWEHIHAGDVVITPAFGTTIEIANLLRDKGVDIATYDTTCPFVERVWKRSAEMGQEGYTIVIHGKYRHEETRATFSHSQKNSPTVVIRDMKEAQLLAAYVRGEKNKADFEIEFRGKYSDNFDPERDLQRLGVVNQTTMLATETQGIADYLKEIVTSHFQDNSRFVDTRDTLCYATNDNQTATLAALEMGADLALVVGGYNSSNTSQIVTILADVMPAYFICDADEILSTEQIRHFDYPAHALCNTMNWLPKGPIKIVVTSGASCPDMVLEAVLHKVLQIRGLQVELLRDAVNSVV